MDLLRAGKGLVLGDKWEDREEKALETLLEGSGQESDTSHPYNQFFFSWQGPASCLME